VWKVHMWEVHMWTSPMCVSAMSEFTHFAPCSHYSSRYGPKSAISYTINNLYHFDTKNS